MKRKFDMKDTNIRAGVKGITIWFILAIAFLVIAREVLNPYPIWANAFYLISGLYLGGMAATLGLTQMYIDGKVHFNEELEESKEGENLKLKQ